MLKLPGRVKIFLCRAATDMRKSFDSLAALVAEALHEDPLSGHLFVFRSRRGDRIKLLYWDEDGYALWYKRLEAGTFRFPAIDEAQASVTISAADLTMLLDGVDLASVRRNPRSRHTGPQFIAHDFKEGAVKSQLQQRMLRRGLLRGFDSRGVCGGDR